MSFPMGSISYSWVLCFEIIIYLVLPSWSDTESGLSGVSWLGIHFWLAGPCSSEIRMFSLDCESWFLSRCFVKYPDSSSLSEKGLFVWLTVSSLWGRHSSVEGKPGDRSHRFTGHITSLCRKQRTNKKLGLPQWPTSFSKLGPKCSNAWAYKRSHFMLKPPVLGRWEKQSLGKL